jgi:thioredoxin-dependent peroxiredoxin
MRFDFHFDNKALNSNFIAKTANNIAPVAQMVKRSFNAGMAIEEGSKAPAFSLPTYGEKKISLKDFSGKFVVLYFYPKDLTPGCTTEACDFRDSVGELKKRDAVVLGISRDPVKKHESFRDKHALNFPLLSDENGKVCEAYGVWKEKSLYGRKFMGIERTTFVIDPAGKILKIFPKVKVTNHVATILELLGGGKSPAKKSATKKQ